MRAVPLIVLAALGATPRLALADRGSDAVRSYMAAYTASRLARAHAMIPAWARKYNMNCTGCHYPAPPRLNGSGQRFKWAGYRMPEEIGEKVTVEKFQNYIAARGRIDYNYQVTENQRSSLSEFKYADATVYFAGPMLKSYGAWFELERAAENNLELVSDVSTTWGTQKGYGGLRIGQFHWLSRWGLAGFDRPTGIFTATPLGGNLTKAIPFSFGNDQVGVEAYYVRGNNRASVEVLNGINATGKGDEGGTGRKKDFVVIDNYLLDDAGSGISAVGYYGSVDGLAAAAPTLRSHFWRVGITASKIVTNFEAQGAVLFAKDYNLPLAQPDDKGVGYWVQAQYQFPKAASFTLYGRYEFLDQNTDIASNGTARYLVGGVMPWGLPEYIRVALDGVLDVPRTSGLPKKYSMSAELMINF